VDLEAVVDLEDAEDTEAVVDMLAEIRIGALLE